MIRPTSSAGRADRALDVEADNRCSMVARCEGLDPGGTAAAFDVLILVERPMPWPADVAEAPDVAEVVSACTARADGRRVRVQTIVGVGHGEPNHVRRVLCYERATGYFDGFHGVEVVVAGGQVAAAAAALVTEEGRADCGAGAITVRDLLICGHGARDRCCGSFGTKLAMSANGGAAGSAWVPSDVRLWRTSHTGGHRFAPTAIVLPQGDVWGFLTAEALEHVLRRDVAACEVIHHYRGSAGMASPALQLLDRFALGNVGWSWQDQPRRTTEEPVGDGVVRVQVDNDAGSIGFEGLVGRRRHVDLPKCGGPAGEFGKPVEELELLAVTRRPTVTDR